ncbi:MAG TPA: GNAT family N-acetyltransferase [Reyranella sp.]|jgi:RimJ/RimL family protein N-acetyltransferase|nr:GNAT family N-acetyltransferase [Reyranella sp.]
MADLGLGYRHRVRRDGASVSDAIIRTERLMIRPFRETDISERYIGWLNDKHLMRFSENRHRSHTRESCLNYLRSFEGSPNRFWAIFAGAEHVGNITAHIDTRNGVADVGILIGEGGKGYGLEAWTAVCWHLLANGVRKITAGTMAINKAMIRIMEKSGMEFEGSRHRQFLVNGEEVDMIGACLLKHHAPIAVL